MPWFIKTQTGERGPYPSAALKELIAAGKLNERVMIRREGQTDWIQAGTVESLFPPGLIVEEPSEPVATSRVKKMARGIAGAARYTLRKIQKPIAASAPDSALRTISSESSELTEFEPAQPVRTHGWGVASLVLGIFSILIFWLPYLGVGLSLAACTLGIVGLIRTLSLKGNGITSALAGTTISFCGIVLGGAWTMLVTAALSRANQLASSAASPAPVPAVPVVRPHTDDEPADALLALAPRHVAPAPTHPRYTPPAYVPPPTRVAETPAPSTSPPVKRAHSSSSGRYKESEAEKMYEKMKGVEVVHRKDGTTYERKARKKK